MGHPFKGCRLLVGSNHIEPLLQVQTRERHLTLRHEPLAQASHIYKTSISGTPSDSKEEMALAIVSFQGIACRFEVLY